MEKVIFLVIFLSLIITWTFMFKLHTIDIFNNPQVFDKAKEENRRIKANYETMHRLLFKLEEVKSNLEIARVGKSLNQKMNVSKHEVAENIRNHLLTAHRDHGILNQENKNFIKNIENIHQSLVNEYQKVLKNLSTQGVPTYSPKFSPQSQQSPKLRDNSIAHIDKKLEKRLNELWASLLSKRKRKPKFTDYNINVSLSDTVPLSRPLPDYRPQTCLHYNKKEAYARLLTASIVVPIYNEALSILLRNVHSILLNTPTSLLKEVILVDDHSTYDDLAQPLDNYVNLLPKVQLIRNEQREGLIRSRLIGAAKATGDVLIFLDAHIECTKGWLEPLVHYLKDHPTSVIQPEIDEINPMTLKYQTRIDQNVSNFKEQRVLRGSFMWDLRFTWSPVSREEMNARTTPADPYNSLTLVGCAIAIRKDYFEYIGRFDEEMNIWGGENIELAFRAWMCGGEVKTIPCSHVGHFFKPFSYSFDGNKEKIVGKNLMRIAEVWMDEYKKYFYASWRVYPFKRFRLTRAEKQSIKFRKSEIQSKLFCKSFHWYMISIANSLNVPPPEAIHFGEIFNVESEACLRLNSNLQVVVHSDCFVTRLNPEHEFYLTPSGQLKHVRYPNNCVELRENGGLKLDACSPSYSTMFTLLGEVVNGHITMKRRVLNTQALNDTYVTSTEDDVIWCLQQVTYDNEQMPMAAPCDMKNKWQMWWFQYKFDYSV